MHKISFVKKAITCVLAGFVMGAGILRLCVTYLRGWLPPGMFSIIPAVLVAASVIYVFIWQVRKTNNPATLAFWQGLIRYGVAFDLAEFGWSKIFRRQLIMPLYQYDLPYKSFTPSEMFWTFYSHSYLLSCILGALEIAGAMLLLFRKTRLVGVFVLLPVVANILLMDIFYEVGSSVVVHVSIMTAGVLYFLFIEFDRLKEFFFVAKSKLPVVRVPKFVKMAIRLSVIYIPLLLIATSEGPDRYPQLTGKYAVKSLQVNQRDIEIPAWPDSVLTGVYFDMKNTCVFEFNAPQRRWYGKFTKKNDQLQIHWYTPRDKPVFSGTMSPADSGQMMLRGMLGKDSVSVLVQKTDSVNIK